MQETKIDFVDMYIKVFQKLFGLFPGFTDTYPGVGWSGSRHYATDTVSNPLWEDCQYLLRI